MPRVFAIQIPASRVDGEWKPKYDLSAAERFGELVRVLPFGNVPSNPEPTRKALMDALYDFSPADDYVLLLGDPVGIAQAVHFITVSTNASAFRVLKWDKRSAGYEVYIVG